MSLWGFTSIVSCPPLTSSLDPHWPSVDNNLLLPSNSIVIPFFPVFFWWSTALVWHHPPQLTGIHYPLSIVMDTVGMPTMQTSYIHHGLSWLIDSSFACTYWNLTASSHAEADISGMYIQNKYTGKSATGYSSTLYCDAWSNMKAFRQSRSACYESRKITI